MADLTASAMSDALKEYLDESHLTDIVALQSPLLGLMPKGKFLGRNVPYPMITDPGQASLSATFSVANTNRAGATYDRFLMSTPGRIYAIGGIERDVIDLASSPKGAFKDVTVEVDAKLAFVTRELAHNCFRSENGYIGRLSTAAEGGGNTTLTFADPADVANLGPGARIVAAATASGALRDSGAVYTVDAVNHSAGTATLIGETAITTSSWGTTDFIFRAGDAPNTGSPVRPSGLKDWIPDTDAEVGTFRSVDRSTNVTKLGGLRVDASVSQVREACSEMAARIIANGGMPDVLFVHPLRYSVLEQELDSLATHEKVPARGVSAQIGYNAIRISAGAGSVRIIADPFCPYYRGYMLTMKTWTWHEIGGKRQPRLRDMHGGSLLQQEDADAVKFQAEAKGDLGCTNPGANGVIKFS